MFWWIGTADSEEWNNKFSFVADFGREIDDACYSEPSIGCLVPVELCPIYGYVEQHVVIKDLMGLDKIKVFRSTTNVIIVLNAFICFSLCKDIASAS